MTGLRREPSELATGVGVAEGRSDELGCIRHDDTKAASDSKAAKAMSMRPRRTVTSPLVRKSLTMVLTVVLAI